MKLCDFVSLRATIDRLKQNSKQNGTNKRAGNAEMLSAVGLQRLEQSSDSAVTTECRNV